MLAACAQQTPTEPSSPDVAGASLHSYGNATIVEEAGSALYEQACASCHDGAAHRGPDKAMIALMSARSVHRALTSGVMSAQANGLSDEDKIRVAEYLTNSRMGSAAAQERLTTCAANPSWFDFDQPPALQGWGFTPGNTHYIGQGATTIDRQNVATLKLKWGFAFPDALRVRSRPTLAGGAVFVGSHNSNVYALDQDSGCVRWRFEASAEVRNGIVMSSWQPGDDSAQPVIYFGDLIGNVYAVYAHTGELVWRDRPDSHPSATMTGAPALYEDMLYVPVSSLEVVPAYDPGYQCCTFRGSVVAYQAATGSKVWQAFTTEPPQPNGVTAKGVARMSPSGAPVWNSPVIDAARGQLIFGTGENYSSPATDTSDAILAADMKTGAINWVYQGTANDAWNTACVKGGNSAHPTAGGTDQQSGPNCPEENGPDVDFGAGAMLATTQSGGELVVAGQKSGVVHALDPQTGKLVWKTKVGRGSLLGGVNFGMAVANDRIYVPIADVKDGSGETPAGIFLGERRPGLHALDLTTGTLLWRSPMADTCEGRPGCLPGIAQAIAATDELVFAGGMDGVLRIYDAETGAVLWRQATAQKFDASNGGQGVGGSFAGGGGPVAYGNRLYVSSGYAFNGLMPGNVLLAFEVER